MSQADVDAIIKYLGSDAFLGKVSDAIGTRVSYRDKDPYDATGKTPLTQDRIMNEMFRRSDDPTTLSAASQASIKDTVVAALAVAPTLAQIAEAFTEALGSGPGGTLSTGDVEAALLTALTKVRMSATEG